MKVEKIKELKLNSDLYILASTPKKIIVDSSFNDKIGLSIFNHNLEQIKDIPIASDLSIYTMYKHFVQEKVLLYCPEYNESLIYVDLEKSSFKIIKLSKQFTDITFSPIYLWNNDNIILTSYGKNFYKVFITEGTISEISNKEIESDYATFFQFYIASKNYIICEAYPEKRQIIFSDEAKNKIGLYDFDHNQVIFSSYINPNAHNHLYKNGLFVFIAEDQIDIVDQNTKRVTIKADNPYIFLRACYLKNNNLLVLSGNKQGKAESILTIYKYNL